MPLPDVRTLALVLATTTLGACSTDADLGAPIEVKDVVLEVLVDQEAWWIAKGEPRVGTISPSEYYKFDAADRVSLIMPPPCDVRFTAPAIEGGLLLELAAGVDQATAAAFPASQPGAYRFLVTRNGEVAFERRVEVHAEMEFEQAVWHRPEGGGIPCEAGDELRLRVEQVAGAAVPDPLVGFSGPQFVRTDLVERQLSDEGAPNIILIVQDTLRFDRTNMAGAQLDLTPALERLADSGLRFENAYATSPWTWPSTASILTGLLPEAHGVVSNESCVLPWGAETLAEVLQRRGYSTGAFTRNPLIVPDKGFSQGFEHYDSEREFAKTGTIMPEIKSWVRDQGDRRFFLYLHLADVHGPLEALASEVERLGLDGITEFTSDEIEKRIGWANKGLLNNPTFDGPGAFEEIFPGGGIDRVRELYDACVASGDTYVGELVDELAALGLDDRTVIAFTSDHGEEWLDHGMVRHSHSLYRELVQVPLVLWGPGIPEGVEVAAPVSNRSLAQTLAAFGGAQMEVQEGSTDLVRLASEPEAGPVYFSTHHGFWKRTRERKIFGVRDGDWMLKMGEEAAGEDPEALTFGWELYDLESDPGQTANLAAEQPAKVDELRRLIEAKLAASDELNQETTGGLRVAASGATLEMLGDIGYLDNLED